MAAKNRKPSGGGGVLGDIKSFFLDNPEQRKRRKALKLSGLPVDAAPADSGDPVDTEGGATAVAKKPTRVSRRARLLGGNRFRAVALMALLVASSLVAGLALGIAVSKPSRSDIRGEVQSALREEGQDFPRGQAVAWADQATIDWATWDEADPESREIRMAQYLTNGMDSQAGWNGKGKQTVTFTSVNPEPTVIDEHHAFVDVDYRLDDDSRRCVTIPVYTYRPEGLTGDDAQWAFALSSNPIPRPCAPRTGAAEPATNSPIADKDLKVNDTESRALTTDFYPGFLSAWAASDANALRQYTASGVTTIGLGGAMASVPAPTVSDVALYTPEDSEPVEGTIYHAIVPVTWTVSGSSAQVEAVYDVPMKKVGDRWYVAGEPTPAASTEDVSSGEPATRITPDEPESGGASDGGGA